MAAVRSDTAMIDQRTTQSAQKLADRLVGLLPAEGTPVLNRVMQVMLARELEAPISADLYFEARDLLLSRGVIGRLRGQGGQVFLVEKPSTPSLRDKAASGEHRLESSLMEPLRQYLEGPFRIGLDLPSAGVCIVHDTSAMGPWRGRWARPDFILISAMRFKHMPGAQVDVHSFELKSEAGATDLAVYEALAQTRFTHFGHLVWHLPDASRSETRLPEIINQCEEHGVGLIRMRDPLRLDFSEILVDPDRKHTLPAIVDGFLESRLSPEHRDQLARVVNGGRS